MTWQFIILLLTILLTGAVVAIYIGWRILQLGSEIVALRDRLSGLEGRITDLENQLKIYTQT